MKYIYFVFLIFIFLSGCATIKEEKEIEKSFLVPEYRQEIVENIPDLNEQEKEIILEGQIPIGMEKEKVEEILGSPYGKYVSDSKMMEIWFYDEFFVGFDKEGKVVKFEILKEEEEKDGKES